MLRYVLLLAVAVSLLGCNSDFDPLKPFMPSQNTPRSQQSTVYRAPLPQNPTAQPKPMQQAMASQPPLEQPSRPIFRRNSFPPVKIALLVPLTGQYSKLGKNLLEAAQLALFDVGEPNLILVPLDTKGTAIGAMDAAKKAVTENAQLILGPLFSASAQAIVPIARDNHIEVVSFSNDASLANSGVFSLGFRPEQQIERIMEYAMARQVTEFVTVLPNDAYGSAAMKKLRETVDRNPVASVLKTEVFQVDANGEAKNLGQQVGSALNTALKNRSPKAQSQDIRFPRGMLIPEGGKELAEITAALQERQHDPAKVQLLGSAQWYQPEVLQNPVLEGAWFAGPPSDRRGKFEDNFEEAYGYRPLTVASLAYDGIALAATLARLSDGRDFSKTALVNPRGYVGVDGIFRFSPNGLSDRGLAVMTIRDGRFVVVEPAPQNFYNR